MASDPELFIEPSDSLKSQFRLAIIAGNGREPLDPRITVMVDDGTYTAIIAGNTETQTDGQTVSETYYILDLHGDITKNVTTESANSRLASIIRANSVLRKSSNADEKIKLYMRQFDCSEADARHMIVEDMLSGPNGNKIAAKFIDFVESIPPSEDVDAFELAEVTQKVRNNFPLL